MYFFDTLNFFINSKATLFASECIDPNLILLIVISRDRYVQKIVYFMCTVFTFTQKVKPLKILLTFAKYVMTFSINNTPIKSEIKGESYSFFTSCLLENANFFRLLNFLLRCNFSRVLLNDCCATLSLCISVLSRYHFRHGPIVGST